MSKLHFAHPPTPWRFRIYVGRLSKNRVGNVTIHFFGRSFIWWWE